MKRLLLHKLRSRAALFKKWSNSAQMLLKLSGQIMQNQAKLSIACNPSASLELINALGELGQRFESFRPDCHRNGSQIYQNKVSKVSVAFPWNMFDLYYKSHGNW